MRLCDKPAVLVLESDGRTLDVMDADNGFAISQLDTGYPDVREVTAALPTRDGSYDTTHLFGPRVVSIQGAFVPSARFGSRQRVVEAFMPFLDVAARPTLTWQVDADAVPRTFTLRASALSAPYNDPTVTMFTAAWVCPDPVAYSAGEPNTVTIFPAVPREGFTFNLSFDWTFPYASGGSGWAYVENRGDYRSHPVLRIHGPCTNPAVYRMEPEPEGAVVISGLTVDAGHFLEIDTRTRTVYLDGQPGASRYSYVNFAATRWFALEPGDNLIRYLPASYHSPSQLEVIWRDAWL